MDFWLVDFFYFTFLGSSSSSLELWNVALRLKLASRSCKNIVLIELKTKDAHEAVPFSLWCSSHPRWSSGRRRPSWKEASSSCPSSPASFLQPLSSSRYHHRLQIKIHRDLCCSAAAFFELYVPNQVPSVVLSVWIKKWSSLDICPIFKRGARALRTKWKHCIDI